MTALHQARSLIAKDQTSEALALLIDDSPINNTDLVALTARLHRQQRNFDRGLIPSEEANVERNRVNFALLRLITDELSRDVRNRNEQDFADLQIQTLNTIENILSKWASLTSPQMQECIDQLIATASKRYNDLLMRARKIELQWRNTEIGAQVVSEAEISKSKNRFSNAVDWVLNQYPSLQCLEQIREKPLELIRLEITKGHLKACQTLLKKRLFQYQNIYWGLITSTSNFPLPSSSQPVDESPYGSEYNDDGYNKDGYDYFGTDREGFDKNGMNLRLGYEFDGQEINDVRYYELSAIDGMEFVFMTEEASQQWDRVSDYIDADIDPEDDSTSGYESAGDTDLGSFESGDGADE